MKNIKLSLLLLILSLSISCDKTDLDGTNVAPPRKQPVKMSYMVDGITGLTATISYTANGQVKEVFRQWHALDGTIVQESTDSYIYEDGLMKAFGSTTYAYDDQDRIILINDPMVDDTAEYTYVGDRINIVNKSSGHIWREYYDEMKDGNYVEISTSPLLQFEYDDIPELFDGYFRFKPSDMVWFGALPMANNQTREGEMIYDMSYDSENYPISIHMYEQGTIGTPNYREVLYAIEY